MPPRTKLHGRLLPRRLSHACAATISFTLNHALSATERSTGSRPMAPALHSQPPQRQCLRDAVKSLLAPPMTRMTAMDLPTLFGLLLFTYCGIRTVSLRRMLLALQKSSTEVKYVHRQYRRCCSWSLLNVAPNSKSRRTSRTRKHPRRILWPKPSQRYCKIQRTAISRPRKRTTPTSSRIFSSNNSSGQPSPSSPSPPRRPA